MASQSDPVVGPLTREEARHAHDPLHLTPLQSATVTPRASFETGLKGAKTSSVQTAYNRAGLQREVMAFAPYWSLSQESGWDYKVMSTVVYFGLTLNWDGTWFTSGGGW